VGPTTKTITVTGGVTFNELREAYYTQQKASLKAERIWLLVETCQDTRNIKAAILAIHKLSKEMGSEVPFIDRSRSSRWERFFLLAGQTWRQCGRRCGMPSRWRWDELRNRTGVHDRPAFER